MKAFNVGFADYGVELTHHFSSGVYAKETRIPAGLKIQQHSHTFDHMSLLASGRAQVTSNVAKGVFEGPAVIHMPAGTEHEIEALTECSWFCIHATDQTDPDKIDAELVA